jgi:hypothetical protein
MAPSYPRLAHTARDVQDLLTEVNKHSKGVTIGIAPAPHGKDVARLRVDVHCTRKGYQIGTSNVARAQVYVPGSGTHYLDKAVADALWALLEELEAPRALWGRYTTLTE